MHSVANKVSSKAPLIDHTFNQIQLKWAAISFINNNQVGASNYIPLDLPTQRPTILNLIFEKVFCVCLFHVRDTL